MDNRAFHNLLIPAQRQFMICRALSGVFQHGRERVESRILVSQTARNILSGEVPHAANPHLDDQTDPGLTGAHGSSATILEPTAENREAVCSQPRRFSPSGDGQT